MRESIKSDKAAQLCWWQVEAIGNLVDYESYVVTACDRQPPGLTCQLKIAGETSPWRYNIDMEIVGDCTSADEATSQIEMLSPNIVLMDAQLPGMNGIETCRHLTGNGDDCDVTMLSTCQELISDALKAGAAG